MKTYLVYFFTAAIVLPACSTSTNPSTTNQAPTAPKDILVSEHTTAPLRVKTRTRLDRPSKEVWAYLSNHDNLVEYSNGVLGNVMVDGSKAEPNGVGTMRTCQTADGSGKFVERIVYVQAPRAFAYVVTENTWGLQNHLATVKLEPTKDGGTLLSWDLYFDHVERSMVPKMSMNMAGMMRGRMLPFLTKKFGGEVLDGEKRASVGRTE